MFPRRRFLGLVPTVIAAPFVRLAHEVPAAPPGFPLQDPALVREMVGVSHNNATRVRELLKLHPALAKAAIDGGYGDWEDALGAASHVGNREIAELLIAHGARPTIFSAAMLGHVDVVRAFVAASPGIQGVLGPHSLPLMSHARAGGDRAASVVSYLEEVGGANNPPATMPLTPDARASYVGVYVFGSDNADRLIIAVTGANLTIQRPGFAARTLRAIGPALFHPAGAEHVRVRFGGTAERPTHVDVLDPEVVVTALRDDAGRARPST